MNYETVDLLVTTDDPVPVPLAGAIVKVLDQAGTLVFGQYTTDINGMTSFMLPAGIYQIRCYKFSISIPKLLVPVVTGMVNQFTIRGTPYVIPSATDSRLCIAAGFFRTASGSLARGVDLHFIAQFDPLLLEGSPVLSERVIARTDDNGFVAVPLIRFAMYEVTVQGMEDMLRCVYVPDRASVNIGDLLFPVVTTITFEEPGPYTTPVGTPLTIHPHVFTSDYRELTDITSDVLWGPTPPQGSIGIQPTSSSITLIGTVAGSFTFGASPRDASIVRIPNTPITGVPITVTFT